MANVYSSSDNNQNISQVKVEEKYQVPYVDSS